MKKQTENTLAVLATAFMSFVGILTETSLNVTFPAMMKQFNVSLDTIQWTTTGYLLMIAIIMISSSYQNERFTAKQLFVTAYGWKYYFSICIKFLYFIVRAFNFSSRCGSLYTNDV